jgi:hypothetical protein
MLDFTALYRELILAVVTSKPLCGMQQYSVIVLWLCMLCIMLLYGLAHFDECIQEVKCKGHPVTFLCRHGGEVKGYFNWFKTLVLGGGRWSPPCLAVLPPVEMRYPLYRRPGGSKGWSCPTRTRSLYRPFHCKSLYQLCYSGHCIQEVPTSNLGHFSGLSLWCRF